MVLINHDLTMEMTQFESTIMKTGVLFGLSMLEERRGELALSGCFEGGKRKTKQVSKPKNATKLLASHIISALIG